MQKNKVDYLNLRNLKYFIASIIIALTSFLGIQASEFVIDNFGNETTSSNSAKNTTKETESSSVEDKEQTSSHIFVGCNEFDFDSLF